jgi:hypothetical protein
MQFALLFYNPPLTEIPEAEREAVVGEMVSQVGAWQHQLERAGAYRHSLRLANVEEAVSLRAQGAELLVSDGPFAETKEILGGLYLIECADREEALDWARRCPATRIGTVELRPEFGAR